jgi:hypothetical protein
MKLDLRKPTLVMAGAWNPAIFRPAWIARYVFDVPVGAEVTVAAVQQQSDGEQKIVIYMNGVGFSFLSNRLELFAAGDNRSAFNAVENAIAKIVELLPHTPMSAYGINFSFIDGSGSPDVVNKIKSYDGLEERFDIVREIITSTIDLEPKVQLSIQRKRDSSSVAFDFNFHRSGVEAKSFIESIHGEIESRLAQTLSVMGDIYGLSSYEVLMHEFDSSQGEREYAGDKPGA